MQVPGLRPGAQPPLHTLGEYTFQELCRDLFDGEPEIATCEIYGIRGEKQDGIDLLAHRRNSDGIEVGQCKCYADFPPLKIREASQDFFDHWARWSTEDVRRFILFVACDMSSRPRQDEIAAQKQRFAEHGIIYEVWSVATIVNRLRPHRGIVAHYFTPPDHWVSVICGETQSVASVLSVASKPASGILPAILGQQIEQLAALLSTETERGLANMQQAAREGRPQEALAWIEEIRNVQERWLVLAPDIKARLLRFAASLLLTRNGDAVQATAYADEARALMPDHDDRPLRALIAAATVSPEAALDIVSGVHEVEHRLVHAMLLLDLGRGEACRALLDDLLAEHPDHAEALHLRALAHLINRDLVHARVDSQQALVLAPTWHSVRFSVAMITYFSALSPSSLPDRLVRWPEPIEWAFVRRDDAAQTYLNDAQAQFRALAAEATADDNRRAFETWALACLANDSTQQEAAIANARTLLAAEPSHFGAVAWSLARSFGIDLRSSERTLAEQIDRRQASIPQVLALVSCYMSSGRSKHAMKLVERVQPLFARQGMMEAWNALQLQLSLQQRGALPSQTLETTDDPDLVLAVASAMRRRARTARERRALMEYVERSLVLSDDPRLLLFWYEGLLESEQWEQAAEQASRLLTVLGTATALGLAAVALYNARRFSDCLQLIETQRSLYARQALPIQLRRIRGLCRLALGQLSDARADLEMLVREDPSADHLLTLVQLHIDRGDYAGITLVARQLAPIAQVPPEVLLRLASLLQHDDHQLAVTLWHKAEQAGFPDVLVGLALNVAFQFGLEAERRTLLPRMAALAEQGQDYAWRWDWDELTAFMRNRQEQRVKLETAYRRGEAPIQIIAQVENIPLVEIYHSALARNAASPDPLRQPALLARHGGRTLPAAFSADVSGWRLHLDVSAVLIAAHLEILDLLEGTFRSLHLPQDLIPTLIRMREQLAAPQPERLRSAAQIRDLVRRGLIQVINVAAAEVIDERLAEEMGVSWYTLFQHAWDRQGYLVDFLPLQRQDRGGAPLALPDGADQMLINCRAIVEALWSYGPLSQADHEQALDALGIEGQGNWLGPIPQPGALLIFHANTPEMLAEAHVLEAAAAGFRVVIEQDELDRLNAELEIDGQRRVTDQWLGALIRKLGDGIDAGTFTITPPPPPLPTKRRRPSRGLTDVPCLETLLRFDPQEGDIIWCDDRTINAYQHRDGMPLIGVNEVLKALLAAGSFDATTYYDRLLRLRAANVRFIPLEAEEILYHLRQARVEAGTVIETRGLRVIRRSIAAALIHSDILQRPPLPTAAANLDGELAWLHAHMHAVVIAIGAIWSEEGDSQHCAALAEWVLDQLYLDHLAFHHLLHPKQDQPGDTLLAAPSLGHLIMQSLVLDVPPDRADLRSRYLGWLRNRVLLPRFATDPQLVGAVGDVIKSALLGAQAAATQSGAPQVVRHLLATVFADLPSEISDALVRDPDFSQQLELVGGPSIVVGDLLFDPDAFWQAATAAMNGRLATISARDSTEPITFRPPDQPGPGPLFAIERPITGQVQQVAHPDLALLAGSEAERLAVLHHNLAWFDCGESEREAALQEVATCADPHTRIQLVEQWRESSATVYYHQLWQFLRDSRAVDDPGLLPPSVEAVLRHLRLNSDIGTGTALHRALQLAADDLIRTEGLAAAMERLSGLPMELPIPLQAAVEDLSASELRGLIKHILRFAASPPAIMHLLRILIRTTKLGQAGARLTRRLISTVVGPNGRMAFSAFHSLLMWVSHISAHDAEQRALPAQLRLTLLWSHAHRLFAAFVANRVPVDVLHDRFGNAQLQIPPDIFDPPLDYWYDCAHPRALQFEPFVLSGLVYALRDQDDHVLTHELAERIWTMLFATSDGEPRPSRGLLRDTGQAGDVLASWIGGDPGARWAPLLGDELAANFRGTALQAVLTTALNPDESSQDRTPWAAVQVILGDLPPYPELAARLAANILSTNFADLVERNRSEGLFALRVATLQSVHLEAHGVLGHLHVQFAGVIAVLRNHYTSMSGNDAEQVLAEDVLLLVDIAAHLARGPGAAAAAIRYRDILTQLLDSWPAASLRYRALVQRLCEELPLEQAQHFWRLLVRLRAE